MNVEATVAAMPHGHHDDPDYAAFLKRVEARFQANLQAGESLLFTTDADGMWAAYLAGFPTPALRQHHNCSACRQFIERYGALATLSEKGAVNSAVWDAGDAPAVYALPLQNMARLVRRAKVTGVFLSSAPVWGTPLTGEWQHFSVTPPARIVYARGGALTAGQKMAEKREDFKTVMHALNEFTQPHLELAITLLRSDALYRSEKVLGQAEWLHGTHVARAASHGDARANSVWRRVAAAPAGFCHPRASMIGTLLEDIAAGMDFGDVSRRFAAKMHPLQYQRPQAAPPAGLIAAAEKLFAQMGLAPALERRIARLEEVPKLWEPKPVVPADPAGGIFGHIQAKNAAPGLAVMAGVPPVVMTLEKFVRTVVPTAECMEVCLGVANQAFIAITTAVHADAPPLMQWEGANARNPFAWYVWASGAPAAQYGLSTGWAKVSGITRLPARWNESVATHHGDGIILLIEGARETRNAGAALHAAFLRSDLHGVRSVIEAYSRGGQMQGLAEGSAIGYDLRDKSGGYPALLRVQCAGRALEYKIDRWD